jgi:hypothetical protein
MHGTQQQRLSPASIAHLRKVAAEINSFIDVNGSPPERPTVDAAWAVLEAAIDLDDGATVDAARRVIDASLGGETMSEADMLIVSDYFK